MFMLESEQDSLNNDVTYLSRPQGRQGLTTSLVTTSLVTRLSMR